MKTSLITSLFLFLISNLFAQDKIVFRDGKIVEGKVIEIGPSEITYKKPEMADGPLYSVSKRDVNSIVFQNGQIELITTSTGKRNRSDKEVIPYKNRIAATYFLPYAGGTDETRPYTTVGIWYERRLMPFFSIKIPFELNAASYNQSFLIGIMPKFYFNRSKIIQGFAGPELLVGFGKDRYYDYNYYSYDPYFSYSTTINRASFMNTAAANVGMSINPVEHFNITMDMGIGANIFNYLKTSGYYDQSYAKFMFKMGLSMGYNF